VSIVDKMDKVQQDLMILKFVMPYDKILNDKDAFWDEDNHEMFSSERYLALREFNKRGYRVLQFVPNRNNRNSIESEWVLVEKL
jgi:hypothetical protein